MGANANKDSLKGCLMAAAVIVAVPIVLGAGCWGINSWQMGKVAKYEKAKSAAAKEKIRRMTPEQRAAHEERERNKAAAAAAARKNQEAKRAEFFKAMKKNGLLLKAECDLGRVYISEYHWSAFTVDQKEYTARAFAEVCGTGFITLYGAHNGLELGELGAFGLDIKN